MDISKDITGRRGVAEANALFTEFGWVFRERPILDYGIDADVEQVINSEPTSKHIALQIKSGDSYCKENKNGRIVFSFDEWHYKYWLDSDRPVVILFYDPNNKQIYWEQVRMPNLTKVNGRHRIEVETTHVLSKASLEELNQIINTHSKLNLLQGLDPDCVNLEFSISCLQELNTSISGFIDDIYSFKKKLETQLQSPNDGILCSLFNTLRIKVTSHIDTDYNYLHKSSWYLVELAKEIDLVARNLYLQTIEKNKKCVEMNIYIWKQNISFFSRLLCPVIPLKVQAAVRNCITKIEDYIAILEYSLGDWDTCTAIINQRSDGQDIRC